MPKWWGEAPERLNDFDEAARLLRPKLFGYAIVLAEPGYPVNKVNRVVWTIHTTISPKLDSSDTTDPWLGTRIDLAQRSNFPTSAASLIDCDSSEASSHQIFRYFPSAF